jgi:hypothetical protein
VRTRHAHPPARCDRTRQSRRGDGHTTSRILLP